MAFISDLPTPTGSNKGWPWDWESYTHASENLPTISVITPSFNQGEFLEAALRSVLLQNYPNLEYIVLDGGSTDNSIEIIRRYAPWLSYWRSGQDQGQYHAINEGFSRSNGDIMLWLNSDDMLFPNALNSLADIFSHFTSVEWLTGMQVFFDRSGKKIQPLNSLPYNRWFMRHGCYESRTIHWVMQEATAWRRSLWEKAGGYIDTSHELAGDFELWYRFSQHSQLYSASVLIGGNRQHAGQKTARFDTYEAEVDKILQKDRYSILMNRILSISIIRKLVRAILLSTKNRHLIEYHAKSMAWRIAANNQGKNS